MIIKPNTYAIQPVIGSGYIVGLSLRFVIANPQPIQVPLHNYKIDTFVGLRDNRFNSVQSLTVFVRNKNETQWEEWATIPLGYRQEIRIGYANILRQYMGCQSLSLATMDVGFRCANLVGGDSVSVLVSIASESSSVQTVPDDFLPF